MKKKIMAAALALGLCCTTVFASLPVFAEGENDGADPYGAVVVGEDGFPQCSVDETEPVPMDMDQVVRAVRTTPNTDWPKVRVIIENNTFTVEDGAPWDGVLCDEWVQTDADSTMFSVIKTVIENNGFSSTGLDQGFITEVNGLTAEAGGEMGCYLMMLDNWMIDSSAEDFTVADGFLVDDDEIKLVYSTMYGMDLGYDYSGTDTSLKSVNFSQGQLSQPFTSDCHDYILTLPDGVDMITVSCEQTNIAYRAKVYHNCADYAYNGIDFKPSQKMEVVDGEVILIVVGYPMWSSYPNDNAKTSFYTFRVRHENTDVDFPNIIDDLIRLIDEPHIYYEELVKYIRERYDALSPEEKAQVKNYNDLLLAEKAIENFKAIGDMSIKHYDLDNMLSTEEMLAMNVFNTFDKVYEYGSEWELLNYARSDSVIPEEIRISYMDSLRKVLDQTGETKLSNTRSTTNSLVVMALTSIGADPRDFYGYDLLSPLSDYDYVMRQGLNGAVYALLALDSHNYDFAADPDDSDNSVTRKKLISAILDEQQQDGGWTIDTWSENKTGSDADMTAMALQALAPYYNKDDTVTEAINKALYFLMLNQDENGMFSSYGSPDCESCAQTVVALCALDWIYDSRFCLNCNDPYKALNIFYVNGTGKFSHYPEGEVNELSTVQGYQGVVAMWRYENSMTSYFDMSDVKISAIKTSAVNDSSQQPPEVISQQESSTQQEIMPVPKPMDNFNTGDSSSAAALVFVMLVSAAAAAAFLRRRPE